MVSVYALLCVAALARSECSPATAIDVLRMPDADNELACLQGSMMTLARLAVQAEAGDATGARSPTAALALRKFVRF
jgi:hypothetical protein